MRFRKLFVCIILCLCSLLCISTSALEQNSITVILNGLVVPFDVSPKVKNDRILVPMRKIFEQFGAQVEWNDESQTVTAAYKDTTVTLIIGDNTAWINNVQIKLDVPAMIDHDTTFVPIRFICEVFEATVEWDEAERTVKIQMYDIPASEDPQTNEKIDSDATLEEIADSLKQETNPFEKYELKPGGKNLYDRKTSVKDMILQSDGTLKPEAGWDTSDFIKVEPDQSIAINYCRYLLQFDKNRKPVEGTYQNIDPEAQAIVTMTSQTQWIWFTVSAGRRDTAQVEAGNRVTEYEDIYYSIFSNGIKIVDLNSGNLIKLPDYKKYIDREKYQIFVPKDSETSKVRAVLRNVAVRVTSSGSTIEISTNGINGPYDNSVIFNAANFPGLIADSFILHISLLPWSRNLSTMQYAENWRMVIVTDKGQIYHNYPSRGAGNDGDEMTGDITKFEESVVWDLPDRKYPSANPTANGSEYYFPCLPAEAYIHHPVLNSDETYSDPYGNGGFGISVTKDNTTFPRFYRPSTAGRTWNSFTFMGGYEPGDKLTLIGTYNENMGIGNGCRICVFASDDGGRSWYNKYEFGDMGDRPNWGNTINTGVLASPYQSKAFSIRKRTNLIPTSEIKEPVNLFEWGSAIAVEDITRANPAIVTTVTPHNLITGNVIAFQKNKASSKTALDWIWMLNDTVSEISGGNGVLFKVEVVDDKTFRLHEYVHSPHNNITSRHIHAINAMKDGWTINCGESYPNGWIFYAQMLEADAYAIRLAHQPMDFFRLTSGQNSIQRTIGSILLDDKNESVLFASDNDNTARSDVTMPPERTSSFARNSTGIYKGKLSDIDDMSKFHLIYETGESAYFFKLKSGALIFLSQLGEFAISFDMGETWEKEELNLTSEYQLFEHFQGEANNRIIVIDDFIIVIK